MTLPSLGKSRRSTPKSDILITDIHKQSSTQTLDLRAVNINSQPKRSARVIKEVQPEFEEMMNFFESADTIAFPRPTNLSMIPLTGKIKTLVSGITRIMFFKLSARMATELLVLYALILITINYMVNK